MAPLTTMKNTIFMRETLNATTDINEAIIRGAALVIRKLMVKLANQSSIQATKGEGPIKKMLLCSIFSFVLIFIVTLNHTIACTYIAVPTGSFSVQIREIL